MEGTDRPPAPPLAAIPATLEVRYLVEVLAADLSASPLPPPPPDCDWDRLERLAAAHGVLPLLCHLVLRHLPADSTPPAIVPRWKAIGQENARKNLALTGQLFALLTLFQDHGIHAVPLKGPVLALLAYRDPGLRTIRDLDFVLRREHVLAARDLLEENGFQMASETHWPSRPALLRSANAEFTMISEASQVDIHWRLLPNYFPFHLDAPALWERSGTRPIAGQQVPAFAPEHELLYLAAHGAKHDWARLQWVCDLAKYLQAVPVDWDRAFALCVASGSERMLTHALALVESLFGIPLPPSAASRIDPQARNVAESLIPGILRGEGQRPGFWEEIRFLGPLSAGPFALARYILAVTVAPTEAEWALLPLPPLAYPLYYPFRVLRMAWRWTLGRHFS